MNTVSVRSLLVAISRALQCEQRQQAVAAGLPAVQWNILHCLSMANRYSNTPQALTEYLELTKGTVSQSLKRLEARGSSMTPSKPSGTPPPPCFGRHNATPLKRRCVICSPAGRNHERGSVSASAAAASTFARGRTSTAAG
ncbi:MAG: MarR family transcriptional regulator [Zoogloeaceae bacterium]|nr:MarR family transcriptional regulator [Zoogloeaceae bacterium]